MTTLRAFQALPVLKTFFRHPQEFVECVQVFVGSRMPLSYPGIIVCETFGSLASRIPRAQRANGILRSKIQFHIIEHGKEYARRYRPRMRTT